MTGGTAMVQESPRRRIGGRFLVAFTSALVLLIALGPAQVAVASPEREAVMLAIQRAFETRAQAGLKPGDETLLAPLYDRRPAPSPAITGPRLLAWEEARARYNQRWQQSDRMRVISIQVAVTYRSLALVGDRASVEAQEHQRVDYLRPSHPGRVERFEQAFDHRLELVQIDGRWLIRKDEYLDAQFQPHLGPDHRTPLRAPGAARTGASTPVQRPTDKQTGEQNLGAYAPQAAVAYATRWWNSFNPRYRAEADDCTNFISQVLGDTAGGGAPQLRGSYLSHWYYDDQSGFGSLPWVNADALQRFLTDSPAGAPFSYGEPLAEGAYAAVAEKVSALQLGDLITYAWPDGLGQNDQRFDHTTVITGFDAAGEPLVTAHTHPIHNAPWHLGHVSDPTHFKLIRMRQRFPLP
jgi:hypothetical protein